MRSLSLALAALAALSISLTSRAGTEENADEFMELHKVEIAFHEAGSTKNLNEMLSLFADDAVLTTIRKTDDGKEQIKTYTGKEQIKNYWQAHPAFNHKTNGWAIPRRSESGTPWKATERTYISSAYGWTRRPARLPPTRIPTISWRASMGVG
jgi:hypothetical protein